MRRWMITGAALALTASVEAGPRSAGKWLTDLGRDYPLTPQAGVSDADARLTLLFMQAGSRLEPGLAEAYLWQFDMLRRLGQESEAQAALAEYVRLEPADVAARLAWIALTVDARQTAEERAELCRSYLAQLGLPPEASSDLHRRLAMFHLNRGDRTAALAEAETALRDYALNFAARSLRNELRPTPPSPIERADELLTVIAASPAQVQPAWELGDLLRSMGMPVEADRWYRHAAAVLALMAKDTVEPSLLAARAHALIDAGRLDEAESLAAAALEASPGDIPALRALARIARQRGQTEAAQAYIDDATVACRDVLMRSRGELDPVVVAKVAWFLAHDASQPTEAEKLARLVLDDQPASIIARRALGAALRQLDKPDEARQTLEPIADVDAWARLELAQVLHDAGESDEAARRLREVGTATQPASVEAREGAERLAKQWQVTPPTTQPAPAALNAALRRFPEAALDYPFHPEKYIALRLSVPANELPPAEPWWLTATLQNVGPFPVTLGESMMLVPDLLCVTVAQGDRRRTSGRTIRVSLNRATQLAPGDSISVTQTIDIGAMRASMIGTPQVEHEVSVRGVINPVDVTKPDGQVDVVPGVGGLVSEALKFRRTALPAGPAQVASLIRQSQEGAMADRIMAMEQLAMLLAEHQHLAAGRLHYTAHRIDPARVQGAVLARASDADWQVRARLAEALRWFVLDRQANQTAARLLADGHWLVRGLTLRTLVDQYRGRMADSLRTYAKSDPDRWVRGMAQALLDRLEGDKPAPTAGPGQAPNPSTTGG